MKIIKIKSSTLSRLLFVLVAIDLLILVIILIIPTNKNTEKKSDEILHAYIPTPTPIPLSPLPTPAPIPEHWNQYTITNFNFTQEMKNEYPKIAKGHLTFKYPNSWYVNDLNSMFTNQKKYGVFTGKDLIKEDPAFKNSPQGEGPKPGTAVIRFVVKQTTKNPNELIENFDEEFGHGTSYEYPQENTKFNGYKAAMMRTGHPVPEEVVFKVDENTAIIISIEFFNYALDEKTADKKYVNETEKEINQILSSITFTKQ